MERFFAIDGKFFRVMSTLADLIILNLMWFIASIPLITIGASTTALFSVTKAMLENKDSYIIKSFWRMFLKELRPSTFLWLIFLTAQIFFLIGQMFLRHIQWSGREYATIIMWMGEILFLLLWVPIFPLRAFQQNLTVPEVIKLSVFTALAKLPWIVMTLTVITVSAVVTAFYPILFIPVWLFIGIAGNTWFISLVFLRRIKSSYRWWADPD